MDIIRLDAVPYIWKALGTNCRNLPQVHSLVRMMRIVCEIVCPGTLLLGEVVMEPSKVVPYFGTVEKPECHMLYNVTTMASIWHTVATKDVRLLAHQMEQVFALPGAYTFLNYLRCHDDIGWGLDYGFLRQFGQEEVSHKKYLNDYLTGKWPGSPARGELYNDDPRLGDARLCGTTASLCGIETPRRKTGSRKRWRTAIRLDIMLHAFMFTMSGIPIYYSGDEIAMENDYTYHDDPLKAADSRYVHRGNMDWEKAKRRNDKDSPEGQVFAEISRQEKIRAKYGVFDDDADVWSPEHRKPPGARHRAVLPGRETACIVQLLKDPPDGMGARRQRIQRPGERTPLQGGRGEGAGGRIPLAVQEDVRPDRKPGRHITGEKQMKITTIGEILVDDGQTQ